MKLFKRKKKKEQFVYASCYYKNGNYHIYELHDNQFSAKNTTIINAFVVRLPVFSYKRSDEQCKIPNIRYIITQEGEKYYNQYPHEKGNSPRM
jgi:hypothetical protein